MTRGAMPLEDIWREFFRWRGDPSLYSIYVLPHHGYKYPPTSIFFGKEIENLETVKWGGMSQVRGIRSLFRAALEDPDNEWFCLMSESCIPLVPLPKWRNSMLANNRSIINACDYGEGNMETNSRWKNSLNTIGMEKKYWRKSANWVALIRKHAALFSNASDSWDAAWDGVPCVDEHFLPSLIAYHGLEHETTCSDGLVHVKWPNDWASHPVTYSPEDINPELFAYFERPIGNWMGFNIQCSGFKELCHFTARKFTGASRIALLENIDIILSEEDYPYTGDPWEALVHESIRVNGTTYYFIDNGEIREIPDNYTYAAFHLHPNNYTLKLSENDLNKFRMGPPLPSRQDGTLIKVHRNPQVWVIYDGRRHAIPNLNTFVSKGWDFGDVKTISTGDMDLIGIGPGIPSV
eukprot:gene8143-11022_t